MPFTLRDKKPDYACLKPAASSKKSIIQSLTMLTFDRLSSVFLSNTNHEEDQPCHLQLADTAIPIQVNLPTYGKPLNFCPAGVYEVITDGDEPRFQINAQNCVHCQDLRYQGSSQNIRWVTPEGLGGPNTPICETPTCVTKSPALAVELKQGYFGRHSQRIRHHQPCLLGDTTLHA